MLLTSSSSLVDELSRLGSHVIDDLSLEPWGLQVPSFLVDDVANTAKLIKLECSVTGFNCSHKEQSR